MTFDDTVGKIQLTEKRVIHTTKYMHKDMQDGTEVCLLKHPLTVEEWDQILRNQEMVAKLPELLSVFLTDAIGMELGEDEDAIKNVINLTIKTWMEK